MRLDQTPNNTMQGTVALRAPVPDLRRWTHKMKNKRTVGISIAVALVVLSTGWHVGSRWYVLRKVYRSPQSTHRVTMVPAELDLAAVQVTQGVTCNVGYASFVIPDTSTLDMRSSRSGVAVIGESDSLSFGLLPPWNPSAGKAFAGLRSTLEKLPKTHLMRQDPMKVTPLDWIIQIETAHPIPFLQALFMRSKAFRLCASQLLLKTVIPHGSAGVYTFSTQTSRGLVCVGKERGDVRYAHVSIQNLNGTQSVGMIARLPDEKDGDIMDVLPPVLQTFRFTAAVIHSEDTVRELIAAAGIAPKAEEQATN